MLIKQFNRVDSFIRFYQNEKNTNFSFNLIHMDFATPTCWTLNQPKLKEN